MDNEKLIFAYKYCCKMAYKFQSVKYLKEDIIQDFMLYVLEHPEKLEEMKYLKSFVYRHLKWNRSNFNQRLKNKKVFNLIDTPIDYLEGDSSFLDVNDFGQLQSSIDALEISMIKEFLIKDALPKPYKKGNYKRGKGTEIINLTMNGYISSEIAEELNLTQQAVNHSLKLTREKISKHFRK